MAERPALRLSDWLAEAEQTDERQWLACRTQLKQTAGPSGAAAAGFSKDGSGGLVSSSERGNDKSSVVVL